MKELELFTADCCMDSKKLSKQHKSLFKQEPLLDVKYGNIRIIADYHKDNPEHLFVMIRYNETFFRRMKTVLGSEVKGLTATIESVNNFILKESEKAIKSLFAPYTLSVFFSKFKEVTFYGYSIGGSIAIILEDYFRSINMRNGYTTTVFTVGAINPSSYYARNTSEAHTAVKRWCDPYCDFVHSSIPNNFLKKVYRKVFKKFKFSMLSPKMNREHAKSMYVPLILSKYGN